MPKRRQRSPSPSDTDSQPQSAAEAEAGPSAQSTVPVLLQEPTTQRLRGRPRQRLSQAQQNAQVTATLSSLATVVGNLMTQSSRQMTPHSAPPRSPAAQPPPPGTSSPMQLPYSPRPSTSRDMTANVTPLPTAETLAPPTTTSAANPPFLLFMQKLYEDSQKPPTSTADNPALSPPETVRSQSAPGKHNPAHSTHSYRNRKARSTSAASSSSGSGRSKRSNIQRPSSKHRRRQCKSSPSSTSEADSAPAKTSVRRRRSPSRPTKSTHSTSSSEDRRSSTEYSPDRKKQKIFKRASKTFKFDLARRTGKPGKGSRHFTQRKPYMALPTSVLRRVELRESVDQLTQLEYVHGSLRLIDGVIKDGKDPRPYERHLRQVVSDAMTYNWDCVRAWSNEVFEQLETKEITWKSSSIQKERARVSWATGPGSITSTRPVPCHEYNALDESQKCKQESGHFLNGVSQLHTCVMCFYGKGLLRTQHTAKACYARIAMVENKIEYPKGDRKNQYNPNNNNNDRRQGNGRRRHNNQGHNQPKQNPKN